MTLNTFACQHIQYKQVFQPRMNVIVWVFSAETTFLSFSMGIELATPLHQSFLSGTKMLLAFGVVVSLKHPFQGAFCLWHMAT